MSGWKIEGQYMETCNCSFICPCIGTNLAALPTEGDCKAAIALKIDRGAKDDVNLDGLAFIVMMHAPKAMAEGDIKVGLIIDEAADDRQAEAIAAIASGAAGGPMAALGPLVGEVAGIERRPIRFESDGLKFTVTAGELVNQTCEGVESAVAPGEPLYIDNVAHPVNSKLALARASTSSVHVFGIDWDDNSGTRNDHFAPFSWSA